MPAPPMARCEPPSSPTEAWPRAHQLARAFEPTPPGDGDGDGGGQAARVHGIDVVNAKRAGELRVRLRQMGYTLRALLGVTRMPSVDPFMMHSQHTDNDIQVEAGLGRIVVSEIEIPNILVKLMNGGTARRCG